MRPLGELLIDARRLAVLREVARAGSFAGAAAALRHTPSAVSQQIAALERGAGVILVERSTRGVTLTDAGRALLGTADAIHAELQAAAQRLRALAAGGPQALTVVTFASAGEPLLAPALTALTATAGPPVQITVIEAEPDQALASVRDGRADLALLYLLGEATERAGAQRRLLIEGLAAALIILLLLQAAFGSWRLSFLKVGRPS
jgi:DNA-binding transcriptional LysR family regulator